MGVLGLEELGLFDDKELFSRVVKEEIEKQSDESEEKQRDASKIEVEVQAELENGWQDVWTVSLGSDSKYEPLRPLLTKKWVAAHKGIPESVVGLDVLVDGEEWEALAPQKTPTDLGWKPGKAPLRLLAYPTDSRFEESGEPPEIDADDPEPQERER